MGGVKNQPDLTRRSGRQRVTIKELARELGLSITTISRALNGYGDVNEETRARIIDAAKRLGYAPNRNAQRLVMQRTHSWAWIHEDNERKLVDPHYVEVLSGVLRGARAASYDIVMSSAPPEQQVAAFRRYIFSNAVDGFLVDLPQIEDKRIDLLLEEGQCFVVHGREDRSNHYSWVDIDNFGIYYDLTRLLISNGHTKIAFINGDERYTYAAHRRRGVEAALADNGLTADSALYLQTRHPMSDAGLKLTEQALAAGDVTALLYSSSVMAIEGHAALAKAGRVVGENIALASMDDQLHYLDTSIFKGKASFARSSLHQAGQALANALVRCCEGDATPRGLMIPHEFSIGEGLDDSAMHAPRGARG